MNRWFALLLAVPILLTSQAYGQSDGYNKILRNNFGQQVSLIQIIANPDLFEGKRVRFVAFFHLEFEDSGLYLHKEDSDQMLSENSVWIDLPSDIDQALVKKLNNHYVHCEGIFTSKDKGHMGAFAGTLSDVRWLDQSLSRDEINHMLHSESKKSN
jgi:hypothetical protein